jgi:hypothetical protein
MPVGVPSVHGAGALKVFPPTETVLSSAWAEKVRAVRMAAVRRSADFMTGRVRDTEWWNDGRLESRNDGRKKIREGRKKCEFQNSILPPFHSSIIPSGAYFSTFITPCMIIQ